MNRSSINAFFALIGAIIGAGVLGLPYVFAKAGVLLGLLNLVCVGGVVILMNVMLGEVMLRTDTPHMLPKLAEEFLGKKGKFLMFASMFVGIWGAMVAYLIGVSRSLVEIYGFPTILGLNASYVFGAALFVIGSIIIYRGLRMVTTAEIVLSVATISVLLTICVFGLLKSNFANLTTLSLGNLFLPYGVALFAMLGTSAVPEVRKILANDKKQIRNVIILGGLIPMILYAIFGLAVVGVTGAGTTEVATIGLGEAIGSAAILLGNLFAVFAMASSFIILGLCLKDSLVDGMNMKKITALALTVCVPFIIYLLGVTSFIKVLGITGTFAGGLDGILIGLMWKNAKRRGERKPEYTVKWKLAHWLLIAIFTGGIIYTLVDLVL